MRACDVEKFGRIESGVTYGNESPTDWHMKQWKGFFLLWTHILFFLSVRKEEIKKERNWERKNKKEINKKERKKLRTKEKIKKEIKKKENSKKERN